MPSRQRAAALHVAYSAAQLAQGRRIWGSPDILPWNAWVVRELDAARARGEPLPRRLSATEEWLLWREAVDAACSGLQVLMPDALIDTVRRALQLLDDYGLDPPGAVTPEAAVLRQAQHHFRRRCGELSALGTTSWRDCAHWLQPTPRMRLAGFIALGPARQAWLARHGAVEIESGRCAPAGGRPVAVIDCENPALEAEAAAAWCAALLERDARARLLVVVPQLGQQRHLWQRAFAQRLDYAALLECGTASAESAFAIEGGQPLSTYPLVATALHLIALATGQADFEQLSTVLRSAYLAAPERDHRLRIDLWLRERNIDAAQPEALRVLHQPIASALGEHTAAALQSLLSALEAVRGFAGVASAGAGPAIWAQAFASLLLRCGWPGTATLGSDEQQVRLRFDALLGDLAAIALDTGGISAAEAGAWLQQMARRVAFEPATDDVPVTLTASVDDPIVRYDGVWVAGLSADAWPAAARPDPLVPLPLQLAAGVPTASAAGQLRLAARALDRWQHCAPHCVLSWPRTDADLPRDISPLLREAAALPPGTATDTGADDGPRCAGRLPVRSPDAQQFQLERWMAAQAPPLTAWEDAIGPAWPREQPLRGGIRLLELQSLCPFRCFAELRLQARPLPQPMPGIDPRLRGRILHRSLELFWRATRAWAALRAYPPEAAMQLVGRCVQRAADELAGERPPRLAPSLLRREQARTERLIGELLEWERAREPFETHLLESAQQYVIDGATLQVRLDRVDRLGDGRLVVIDYKSGVAERFDPLVERPPRPQLPAYAAVAGMDTAAVVAVYLGRDGVKVHGIADRPQRVPDVPALAAGDGDWPQLLRHWNAQLQGLVREYLGGRASVLPQPGACDYCHLQMFCRIDSTASRASAADAPAADTAERAEAPAGVDEPP